MSILRSSATQSASLQALKFFYEFWQAHSKLTQLAQHQPDYQTRLADIEQRLQQLEAIQAQWLRRAKTQQLVATENVLSGEVITEGKIRTLAQLFALEYQQLMQEKD